MEFHLSDADMDMKATGAAPVSTPNGDRPRLIGAILVDAGRLRPADIEEIQTYAGKSGLPFGEAAVQLKRITSEDVAFALARQFNYSMLPHGEEGAVSNAVLAAYHPQCEIVEELRTVRSRLAIGWLKNAKRNVLAITSPERGEGRSWLAANLSTVFAQAGQRTLLIDGDMRHPQQHRLFNLKNDVGLSALLTGRAGKEIAQRIHPRLRLFVAPTGALPPNPQELLSSQIFDIVLDRFAQQFDLVVLDTPAATDTADAEILAARAGAAIMLTRRNRTRRTRLLAAMDCLTRSGVNVVGSVINDH